MAKLAPHFFQQYFDNDGNPLGGGKIQTYEAGTTTPLATYTDQGGGTPNANPVVLDANGRANIWLDETASYKFEVRDSDDVLIETVDDVVGLGSDDSVTTASIQADAVTQAKIADDAVGADQLQDDASVDGNRAVTTNHIRNGAVTAEKIADGVITSAKLDVPYSALDYSIEGSLYRRSFSVNAQANEARDVAFNNDGTKMYYLGDEDATVYQYSLSTAYDVSTASYDSVSLDVSGQNIAGSGIAFNADGTRLFYLGANETVYQYNLSTGFDLNSATYSTTSYSVATQVTSSDGIRFNNDGTRMYIVDATTDEVFQYDLSTAWDISSTTYDTSFDATAQSTAMQSVDFNADGTKMFMAGTGNDAIYSYSLSSAFDIATASYDFSVRSVVDQDNNLRAITFEDGGQRLYVLGNQNTRVFEYLSRVLIAS